MDATDHRAPDARIEERGGVHSSPYANDDAASPPARWPYSAADIGVENARANPVETPICDD